MELHSKEACFPAGTDVWTDKGLVPIEKLQVGALVLSQDEASGVRALKRVNRTFVHPDQPLLQLHYTSESDDDRVFITPNHPVWVVERGWVNAQDIRPWNEVVLAEGPKGWVTSWLTAYRWGGEPKNSYPKDFWLYDVWNDKSWPSSMPNGATSVLATPGQLEDAFEWERAPYTTDVYNIEVEDFHTYFVGDYGLWVHNKSSAQTKLQNGLGHLPPDDTRMT